MNLTKYDVFTYQISPVTNYQPELFGRQISQEELVRNKNAYFRDIFQENVSFFTKKHSLNYKIEFSDDDFILLRIGNRRTVAIERDFHREYYESEPSCLVAIYNDPNIQLLAIESDKSSFGNSFTVLAILEKAFDKKLSGYHLRFHAQPKYEAYVLWDCSKNIKEELKG